MEYDEFYVRSKRALKLRNASHAEQLFLVACLHAMRFMVGNRMLLLLTAASVCVHIYVGTM